MTALNANSLISKTINPVNLSQKRDYDLGMMFEVEDYRMQIAYTPISNEKHVKQAIQAILVNIQSKDMTVLRSSGWYDEWIEMDLSGLNSSEIVDLDDEGSRWEGGELNGCPCGYGIEYSASNNKTYQGFVFAGHHVCYGKEGSDNADHNIILYKGSFVNDRYYGHGISYDLNGDVDYKGKWCDHQPMVKKRSSRNNVLSISAFDEKYEFSTLPGDRSEIKDIESITYFGFPSILTNLREILIYIYNFFTNNREFVIDGLPNLERVLIDNNYCSDCDDIKIDERDDGICRIVNCPNLRQLEIGTRSFQDFKSFELSNLNSLQSIKFGEWCFHYADFSLKGE